MRRRTGEPKRGGAAGPGPVAERPLPLRHPAVVAAALVAAACVVASVTYEIYETDFWQHLRVGRAVWDLGRVPTTQVWTWPTHGAPDVNSSWGFEALVWPFWAAGGIPGLFAWRWLATLAAFGLLWAVARTLGARGLSPLFVIALCALVYSQRSQIRPETLVAVLLALEMLILETRRRGGPDRSGWIVAIAWVWANVHISYPLGFVFLGLHALAARRAVRRAPPGASPPGAAGLLRVAALALAVSFLNPFHARALWQPFEYFLVWRHEPIFRIISELRPVDWSLNARNGLAALAVGWPLLLVWRARRRGLDEVETLACAAFTALAFSTQRFIGFYALVAAPYAARDLDEWVRSRSWPRWTRPAAARAALASAAAVAVGVPEWTAHDPPRRVGVQWKNYPVAACDFIAAEDVRGRGFNQFRNGGYLLWRFWPDPGRLPFMDIHQAGTTEIRELYVRALLRESGWRDLDRRFRYDWALLSRPPPPGDGLLDFLDADTAWALVFVDDAAALYLKRDGALADAARRHAYRELGAGPVRVQAVAAACADDPGLRARVRAELARQAAASPATSLAHSLLANLAMVEGRHDQARAELEQALAKDPDAPRAHERLGIIALAAGEPYTALRAFERERRRGADPAGLDLRIGLAYQQLGDRERARAAYRRELRRDPGNRRVRELLEGLDAPPAAE